MVNVPAGRHAAAVKAEELQIKLQALDVFEPYNRAMRETEEVVKQYGEATNDHSLALTAAKARATQLQPFKADLEKSVQAILNREAAEQERVLGREEELIEEEAAEVEAQLKQQEEEAVARVQDKQILAKELFRAENLLLQQLERIAQERKTSQADLALRRADEARKAADRIEDLRSEQLREEEGMRRAFNEWRYARQADAAKQRQKYIDSTDANKAQLRKIVEQAKAAAEEARARATDHTRVVRQRQMRKEELIAEFQGARQKADVAREAAADARGTYAREEAALKAEVDAFLQEREERTTKADQGEVDFREGIEQRRKEVQAEARAKLEELKQQMEERTGKLHDTREEHDKAEEERRAAELDIAGRIERLKEGYQSAKTEATQFEKDAEQRRQYAEQELQRRREALRQHDADFATEIQTMRREAEEAHAARLRALEEAKTKTDREKVEAIEQERAAIQRRVKETTAKFDRLLEQQMVVVANAKAGLEAQKMTMENAERSVSQMEKRRGKMVTQQDAQWDEEKGRREKKLQALKAEWDRAKQELDARKAAMGGKHDRYLAELKREHEEVKGTLAEQTAKHAKRREDLQAQIEAERKKFKEDYAKRKTDLEARKAAAAAALEADKAAEEAQEPLDVAAAAADSMQAELEGQMQALDAERRRVRDFEDGAELLIGQAAQEMQLQIQQLQEETDIKLASLKAKLDQEVKEAEADAAAGVEDCTRRLRMVMEQRQTLEETLSDQEEQVVILRASAEQQTALLKPELGLLSAQLLPRDEVARMDAEIADGVPVGDRLSKRVQHEAASIHALHVQIQMIVAEAQAEAKAVEFEAKQLEMQVAWLKDEEEDLKSRAEGIKLSTERIVQAKTQAYETQKEILTSDALEERKRLQAVHSRKRVELLSLPNERKHLLAHLTSRLEECRTRAYMVDKSLSMLATNVSYSLTRQDKDKIVDFRRLQLESSRLAAEENKAVVKLEAALKARMEEALAEEARTLGQLKTRMIALEAQIAKIPADSAEAERLFNFLRHVEEQKAALYQEAGQLMAEDEKRYLAEKRKREDEADRPLAAMRRERDDAAKAFESAKASLARETERLKALEEQARDELAKAQLEDALLEAQRRAAEEQERLEEERKRVEKELKEKHAMLEKQAREHEQRMRDEAKEIDQWLEGEEEEERRREMTLGELKTSSAQRVKDLEAEVARLEKARREHRDAGTSELMQLTTERDKIPQDVQYMQRSIDESLKLALAALDAEAQEKENLVKAWREDNELFVQQGENRHKTAKVRLRGFRDRLEELEAARQDAEGAEQRARDAMEAAVAAWEAEVEVQAELDAQAAKMEARHGEADKGAEERRVALEQRLQRKLERISSVLTEICAAKEEELGQQIKHSRTELTSLIGRVDGALQQRLQELGESERESMVYYDAAEKAAREETEEHKQFAHSAQAERVKQRERDNKDAAQEREQTRRENADNDARAKARYTKEMMSMERAVDSLWRSLVETVAREDAQLDEERELEVARLKAKAELEAERDLARRNRLLQEKYEEERRRAEEETERMRAKVMEDLQAMEAAARASIEEEVRRMQMIQMAMQQEAFARLELTMREKMLEVESKNQDAATRLKEMMDQEAQRAQSIVQETMQQKLQRIGEAWKSNAAAGAAQRDAVASGAPDAELKKYEEEQRAMEAELRAIEAEIARLQGGE
ncbi:unnamed protein product [Pedinophyceae sp. YPF-701]|nr:unnamed protein product [Pedinophyceae sp. YPF-701]